MRFLNRLRGKFSGIEVIPPEIGKLAATKDSVDLTEPSDLSRSSAAMNMPVIQRGEVNVTRSSALNQPDPAHIYVFPASLVEDLARWGKGELTNSPDWFDIRRRYENLEMHNQAKSNPAAFCSALWDRTATAGGWAQVGATRLVIEMVDIPDNAAFAQLMLAAMDFLRSRGIPMAALSHQEREWWLKNRPSTDPWLPPLKVPSEVEFEALDLPPEQERVIARMGPSGHNNVILFRNRRAGYQALIRGASEEDPSNLVDTVWFQFPTLYDLYLRVGEAFCISSPTFVSPDMQPFVPVSPPDYT